jgi:type II secretion system protein C
MRRVQTKKKFAARIQHAFEARIVELSLQNPEFGAKGLLPLLNLEDIDVSVSTVYKILKRNSLQNRDARLMKLEAQQAFEAMSRQDVETPRLNVVPIPAPAEEPLPLPEDAAEKMQPQLGKPEPVPVIQKEKIPRPRVLPVKKAREKTKFQSSRFLTLSNILLLALLVYLGFYTVQNLHNAGLMAEAAATAAPAPAGIAARPENATALLSGYGFISERNLFNVSKEEAPGPKKEIVVEKLSMAKKDLGLLLVGTVVAYDSRLSRAFIDNRKTRQQETYQEGDKAGEVQIIKILRNKVIIATKEGDQLLTVYIEESGKDRKASTPQKQTVAKVPLAQPPSKSGLPGPRIGSRKIERAEVESSFADLDELMQAVQISPYQQEDQSAGFMLGRIPPNSVLAKMGLRNRDVIMGMNGEIITDPDQAADFFQTLAVGGEITINIKRGRGVRLRHRQIKLNIE